MTTGLSGWIREGHVRAAAIAVAVVILLGGGAARGSTILPTNLDTAGPVYGPETNQWLTVVHGSDAGDLTARVHQVNDIYRYTYEISPNFLYWERITSPLNLSGFTGTAGYSFSQAAAANVPDFIIEFDANTGSLAWVVDKPAEQKSAWARHAPITFFFESEHQPGFLGEFGSTWGEGKNATGMAVVPASMGEVPVIPEPASAMLLGVAAMALLRRRGKAVLRRKGF